MEPKWFLQSKTVLGVVVSMLPALAPVFGLSFGADDTALFGGLVDGFIQFGGALFALYGRWVAKSPVSLGVSAGTPG